MPLLQHNLLAQRARMPELQSQHQKDTFPRNTRIDLQEREIHLFATTVQSVKTCNFSTKLKSLATLHPRSGNVHQLKLTNTARAYQRPKYVVLGVTVFIEDCSLICRNTMVMVFDIHSRNRTPKFRQLVQIFYRNKIPGRS